MSEIKWVMVKTSSTTIGSELIFAEAELRRLLPVDIKWCHDSNNTTLIPTEDSNPSDLVLAIAHPWISVESRCLARLMHSLTLGFDIVEACDSRNFLPMQVPDYATFRGMERYVNAYGDPSISHINLGENSCAILRLMTVGAWNRRGNAGEVGGKVAGAYLHDVSDYFSGDRSDVIALIPETARVCLDVGGGLGNFLKLAKSRLGVETHLVELDAEIAEKARANYCADFVTSGDFLKYSGPTRFDCITFLDMLEHVEEPEQHLIHSKHLLSDGGVVIASIPNVSHWSVVADLLEGRWDYAPSGIQCITHLRFFTLKSILVLFERCGFLVEKIQPVIAQCSDNLSEDLSRLNGLKIDLDGLNAYAYLIQARLASR